jgi:hypothetical protein
MAPGLFRCGGSRRAPRSGTRPSAGGTHLAPDRGSTVALTQVEHLVHRCQRVGGQGAHDELHELCAVVSMGPEPLDVSVPGAPSTGARSILPSIDISSTESASTAFARARTDVPLVDQRLRDDGDLPAGLTCDPAGGPC